MRRADAALALALVAVLVAGCGGGGSGSTTARATHSATTTAATPTAATSTATSSTKTTTTSTPTGATSTAASAKPRRREGGAAKRPPSPATPAATVAAALTSPRCDLYTARLLSRSYGGVQGCRAALTSGGRASAVDVVSTQPEGRFALVTAVPRGGPSSGERLAISLIRSQGGWQLEAIHSNVKVGP